MDNPASESGINREVGYGKPPVEHRFGPGNCANPKGRPRGPSLTARLRALLEAGKIDGVSLEGGKQVADRIAEMIVRRAIKGDYRFCSLLLDRVEGKVAQRDRIADEDAGQRVVEIRYVNDWRAREEKP
jgi:hypothetical protein